MEDTLEPEDTSPTPLGSFMLPSVMLKLKLSQDILVTTDMVVMALVMLVTLAMEDTVWVTDMVAITTESVRLKQSQDILDMDMVVMALAMPVILAMGDTVWVTEEDTTMVN